MGKKGEGGDRLVLKWSTPKTSTLDLQYCTSAFRVTPTNVSPAHQLSVLCNVYQHLLLGNQSSHHLSGELCTLWEACSS